MTQNVNFSTVYNVDTEDELTFSLPPEEAIVAAFEYHLGVHGMPTDQIKAKMDAGDYQITKAQYGLCLGPFWARKSHM